mmetsp:Transcript_26007/g.55016  ORF Transcript_26007/g.55016 Transcript_26007/m.55016 type:complete len:680 (-) Transcript_26007:29-2068(-)
MSERQLWEVIGGGEKGGLLVRSGENVGSKKEGERLATGSIVEEVKLKGDRLSYKLVSGSGPAKGWVGVQLEGKALCERYQKPSPEPSVPESASVPSRTPGDVNENGSVPVPSTCTPGDLDLSSFGLVISEEAPILKNVKNMTDEEFSKVPRPVNPRPRFSKKKWHEAVVKSLPGVHYGLVFPFDPAGIEKAGHKFLTEAFHAAGTLPKSNSVTSMKLIPLSLDPTEGEAMGGSSIKVKLEVTYKREVEGLHNRLFVKIPLEPLDTSERFKHASWWIDESESLVNNLMSTAFPFRSPKVYYSDFHPDSINFIHITEMLDFTEEWYPKKPFQICKHCLKYRGIDCPDMGLQRYIAQWKGLGRLTAAYQTGKVGPLPRIKELFQGVMVQEDYHGWNYDQFWPTSPETVHYVKENLKNNKDFVEQMNQRSEQPLMLCQMTSKVGLDFVLNVCPQLFPGLANYDTLYEITKKGFSIQQYSAEVSGYVGQYPELQAFSHTNPQQDNAFYYFVDEACTQLECGFYDWGGANGTNALATICGNTVNECTTALLEEHFTDFIHAWVDEYHSHGGGQRITREYAVEACMLSAGNGALNFLSFAQVMLTAMPKSDKRWKKFTGPKDPEIWDNYVRRATIMQLGNGLRALQSEKLGLQKFCMDWVKRNQELIPPKPDKLNKIVDEIFPKRM